MKLALGTVQFGLPYGVGNRVGQVSLDEARRIVSVAAGRGLTTLDTAKAYGDSETRLGQIGVAGWSVITKLPPLPANADDLAAWVRDQLADSLAKLRVERLDAVLLHRPEDLLSPAGPELYAALREAVATGRARRIGVSIYDPAILEDLLPRFSVDVVQAPYNVLDRQIVASGWAARLRSRGIELHVRSIFLQGLLLMPPAERPARFARWNAHWSRWRAHLEATGQSALEACVRFALREDSVTRVVVGVDSLAQLEALLSAANATGSDCPGDLVCDDPDLINPSRWRN